jgi:hypothetical protein
MSTLVNNSPERKLEAINVKADLSLEVTNSDIVISAGATLQNKNNQTVIDENGMIILKSTVGGSLVSADLSIDIIDHFGNISIGAGAVLRDKNGNTIINEDGTVSKNKLKVRAITFAEHPYNIADDDVVLLVDCTAGDVTVNLPLTSASVDRVLYIKKDDPTSYKVSVLTANPIEAIDASVGGVDILYQWDTLKIVSEGSGWFIL